MTCERVPQYCDTDIFQGAVTYIKSRYVEDVRKQIKKKNIVILELNLKRRNRIIK